MILHQTRRPSANGCGARVALRRRSAHDVAAPLCFRTPVAAWQHAPRRSTHFRHCHPSSLAALCFPGFGMGCVVRAGGARVSDLQQGTQSACLRRPPQPLRLMRGHVTSGMRPTTAARYASHPTRALQNPCSPPGSPRPLKGWEVAPLGEPHAAAQSPRPLPA